MRMRTPDRQGFMLGLGLWFIFAGVLGSTSTGNGAPSTWRALVSALLVAAGVALCVAAIRTRN